MKNGRGNGFTLIELLVVVIILGALAGIVIPTYQNTTTEAKESVLMNHLARFRRAIELYNYQHNNVFPGTIGGVASWSNFVAQVTAQTNINGDPGTDYGPYLRNGIPNNPISKLVTGVACPMPPDPDDSTGWIYDPATGEIRANCSGVGPITGIRYFDM
jgi:prepilin-type N-terminal cleavage/methylation domain-containing protein